MCVSAERTIIDHNNNSSEHAYEYFYAHRDREPSKVGWHDRPPITPSLFVMRCLPWLSGHAQQQRNHHEARCSNEEFAKSFVLPAPAFEAPQRSAGTPPSKPCAREPDCRDERRDSILDVEVYEGPINSVRCRVLTRPRLDRIP